MLFINIIKNHWKAVILLGLASVFFVKYLIITNERDKALSVIENMRLEALKQNERVKILQEQGKRAIASLQSSHVANIQHIGTMYGKELNNDKKTIDNYRKSLNDKLREQSENSASILPDHDKNRLACQDLNTILTGQSEYIKTLEEAGAVCAADYNLCKAYVDSEQSRIGVE